MPRQELSTAKRKARYLTRVVVSSGMNQSAAARKLGVTRQAIQKRIHSPLCQDAFREYLDSDNLREELRQVAREGLAATKTISAMVIVKPNRDGSPNPSIRELPADSKSTDFIDVPDHQIRHKFWHDLSVIGGYLKESGEGNKVQVFVGSDLIASIQKLEKGKVRSRISNG